MGFAEGGDAEEMAEGAAHSLLGSKVLWITIVPENTAAWRTKRSYLSQSNDIWVSQNFHIGCQKWDLANSGSGHDQLITGVTVEARQMS
jgi:hypothetical protein